METAQAPSAEAAKTDSPAQGNQEQQATQAAKVLFGGQEMEIDSFLRSRKHKTKIDGKELEVDYDELTKGYAHNQAANQRMREAAEARKQAEKDRKMMADMVNEWKGNPRKAFDILEKLGHDPKSIAHEMVMEQLNYDLMSDEQREHFHAKKELEKYKQREKIELEAKQKRELEERETKYATDLEQSIVGYLQKNPGIDGSVAIEALDKLILAHNYGEEITVEEAFSRAQSKFAPQDVDAFFQRMLQQRIAEGKIPKELAESVRKADVQALRQSPPKRPTVETEAKKTEAASVEDYFNSLGKRYNSHGRN